MTLWSRKGFSTLEWEALRARQQVPLFYEDLTKKVPLIAKMTFLINLGSR